MLMDESKGVFMYPKINGSRDQTWGAFMEKCMKSQSPAWHYKSRQGAKIHGKAPQFTQKRRW
jgi:hypothetical protein